MNMLKSGSGRESRDSHVLELAAFLSLGSLPAASTVPDDVGGSNCIVRIMHAENHVFLKV